MDGWEEMQGSGTNGGAGASLAFPSRSRPGSSGFRPVPSRGRDPNAESGDGVRVTVTGGTGFLGRALVRHLLSEGAEVTVLTRQDPSGSPLPGVQLLSWPARPSGDVDAPWQQAIREADAVVHLAGASIGQGRWTPSRKAEIQESRIRSTAAVVEAVRHASSRSDGPGVILSASAVGYYGPCGDEEVTEAHPPGSDFLARVCRAWEGEIRGAEKAGVRVVRLRTGLVLDAGEGALPAMLRPFRLGGGGPLGPGRAWVPWIHREDWVRLVTYAVNHHDLVGAVNLCAPLPVRQGDFARALGRRLRRPARLRAPAWALRLALGEMADGLLLSGQRAIPTAARSVGFEFAHPDLEEALASLPLG